MANFNGPLSSPPLVYVLCQVRFTPVPHWEETARKMHEALAEQDFARADERVQGISIEGGAEPRVLTQQRVRFENREATLGYILTEDQLVTHQSAYTRLDDFLENVRRGFQTLVQSAKIPFITRIGLRYVDLITAGKSDALDDYIHPQLRAFAPELGGGEMPVGERQGSAHLIDWGFAGSRLFLKISRTHQNSPIPLDLQPVHLRFARQPSSNEESLILDTDHFVENLRMPPEWPVVGEQIRRLQAPMSQVFKAAITDYAVTQYNLKHV